MYVEPLKGFVIDNNIVAVNNFLIYLGSDSIAYEKLGEVLEINTLLQK